MKLKIVLFSLFSTALFAQGTTADYQRADYIKESTKNKVYHEPTEVTWIDKTYSFWYKIQTPKGQEFYKVNAESKKKEKAFKVDKLAELLSKESGNKVDIHDLPLTNAKLTETLLTFTAYEKNWEYDLKSEELRLLGETPKSRTSAYWGSHRDESEGNPIFSPNKKWKAYIKNSNAYVCLAADPKSEKQLSFDGSPGEFYSAWIYWSPDSKHFVSSRIRPGQKRDLTLIESSPEDQLQPKLHTRNYLKPGDALNQKIPVVFDAENGTSHALDPSLIPNQYGLSAPVWHKHGGHFVMEYNQRGHQKYTVIRMDANTGKTLEVIKETSQTFIHYSGKRFRHYAENTEEMIWMSERDGWNHLYLYNARTGQVKNQITKGEWVVRKVIHVDEGNRRIIFEGSGKELGQDPYLIQYYSVNFDGTGFTRLTGENGNHRGVFSHDYRYFVDTWSRIDQPAETVLRDARDGSIAMKLEKADIKDLLKTGWVMPEVFLQKGRDNQTDIWGMIVRPSKFDPKKKYPIIEYIYAGPHDSFVPKNFVIDSRGDLHQLAELGFIVVQIDGMGTSNRSKAFHDVCWQNLKDSGFLDRIKWIKAAAAKYPYMDVERVGIFGNSAGGQSSAGALLHHPDFYKVAVSSSGCHDNRMDKIWWNEQWMGYPIGKHYEESSNVTHAHKIQGKMLLILGELDDNVDPSSTFQLINRIIKANKWVDFLFVPGMGHSLGGDYGEHRRRDFFVKHLIGVDPPEWKGHINTSGK
jgi:dipeptidyl aminopeptidase/acylaminoacyl peptidase